MKTEKDFIELGEWQLNAFKQRDEYRQVLIKIRNKIINAKVYLTQGDIRQYKSPSAIYAVTTFNETIELIDEVLNDQN